jgi:hypothetical protein
LKGLKTDSNKKKIGFTRFDFGGLFMNRYKQGVKQVKSFGYVGGKEYF